MSVALLLAVFADQEIRGRAIYRTLLIWPYAVAPAHRRRAVALAPHPQIGLLGPLAELAHGVPWDYKLNGGQAMLMVILASAWKQVSYNFIFFLAGLAVDPARGDRGGAHGRRRGWRRFRTDHVLRCWRRRLSSCWW